MDLIQQILIIFFMYYIGEGISYWLPVPVPGSVIGMVLLTILLFYGVVKENQIKEKTAFLFRYMPLIFLPPAVNLLLYLDFFQANWWRLLIVILGSSFVTFAVTGWTVQIWLRFFKKKNMQPLDGKN